MRVYLRASYLALAVGLVFLSGCLKDVQLEGSACQSDGDCYKGQLCVEQVCKSGGPCDCKPGSPCTPSAPNCGINQCDCKPESACTASEPKCTNTQDVTTADGSNEDANQVADATPDMPQDLGPEDLGPNDLGPADLKGDTVPDTPEACKSICGKLHKEGCLADLGDRAFCVEACTANHDKADTDGDPCPANWATAHSCCNGLNFFQTCNGIASGDKNKSYLEYCKSTCGTQLQDAANCASTQCTTGSCAPGQLCVQGACSNVLTDCKATTPTPTNACTGTEQTALDGLDLAALADPDLKACLSGTPDLGTTACCISKRYSLSQDCSTCAAGYLECAQNLCGNDCLTPGPGCTNCLTTKCETPYKTCTGTGTNECTGSIKPIPTNGCDSTTDKNILSGANIEQTFKTCLGTPPPPMPDEFTCCVKTQLGLSLECSSCWGEYFGCRVGLCKDQCGQIMFEYGKDQGCDSCIDSKCKQFLTGCNTAR